MTFIKNTTFLLLLSSNVGKVAEFWTLDLGGGGSGLDVTKLQFSAWNITPGAGGAPYRHGSIFCRLSCPPDPSLELVRQNMQNTDA